MLTDALWVLIIRCIAAAMGFAITALITSTYVQSVVGDYFFLISIVAVFSAISSLGLNNVVLRKCAVSDSQVATVNTSMALVLVAYLIVGPVFYVALIAKGFGSLFFLVQAPLVIASIGLISHGLQGVGRIKTAVFFGSVLHQFLFYVILKLLSDLTLAGLVLAYSATYFATLVCVGGVWVVGSKVVLGFDWELKSYLGPASALILFQVFQEFNVAIGQIALGLFDYQDDLAVYAVCIKISTLISFCGFALNRVYAPKFAKLYSDGDIPGLAAIIYSARNTALLLGLPLVILGSLFSGTVLHFFGEVYAEYSWFLICLLFMQLVALLNGNLAYLMIMTGGEGKYKNHIVAASVLAFAVVCLFIHFKPLLGALAGYFIVQVYPLAYCILRIRKEHGIRYWRVGM